MTDCIYLKKKKMKNTGQLNLTRNPTQPVTHLTRNSIDPFKNNPFWPATQLTRPEPDLTCPFCHV